MELPISYIYCVWLWIWALLFYFGIVSFSPLLSLMVASIFTLYNAYRHKHTTFLLKIILTIVEIGFVLLIINYSDKFTGYDFSINVLLFVIYLEYIWYNNTTFNEIYFELSPIMRQQGVLEYI